jgi:hypothetical protein
MKNIAVIKTNYFFSSDESDSSLAEVEQGVNG